MEKAIVSICGKDYELRFTIGFWKAIKEQCGITDGISLESKLKEDFGNIAPIVIINSIQSKDKPTMEDIENSLDRSVMDVIEQAVINGMTKPERQLLEIAKKQRISAINDIEEKLTKK